MHIVGKWIAGAFGTSLFIFALSPGPGHLIENPVLWEFREQLVFLSGLSAMSLMVLSMVISVRLPIINRLMKGLDKAYLIHKWAGITATVLLLLHWLTEKLPEWLVELGFIPDPGELTDGSQFSDLQINLFQSGVFLAEWTFYILAILVVIALFRRIPYHVFRKSHKIFPAIFLIAAFHAVTAQLKEHWLDTTAGYLLLAMVAFGVAAALVGLFQQIGKSLKTVAEIRNITLHEGGILDIELTNFNKTFHHKPGQYAFLKFAHSTEPHPFTIASSDPARLRFAIKSAGDFTGQIGRRLERSQKVEIEGPYGAFTFDDKKERQIWIAGGIGITPFLARLEHLGRCGSSGQHIDLFYSTRCEKSRIFPAALGTLCLHSGITLHHFNSAAGEYLTVEHLKDVTGGFENVSIWFCGPDAFAECLLKGLKKHHFETARFHYDSFSMR